MITCFQGRHRNRYPRLAEDMFRLRDDAFWTRQRWDVKVVNGMEMDELDEEDPLFVLSLNPTTLAVEGTFRLLPTTGPNLLKSSLFRMFDTPTDIESPLIWECSRLAVTQDGTRRLTPRGVCPITVELMIAACSLALEAGISQLTAAFSGHSPECRKCLK